MGKAVLILANDEIREKAIRWIRLAETKTRVTFNGPQRTIPQNARLHAMITDIAEQRRYHGLKLSIKDWKLLFMDALSTELALQVRAVPNLAGTGFVNLGSSTSELEVSKCGDLMEIIAAWGAENEVVFSDPKFAREREDA